MVDNQCMIDEHSARASAAIIFDGWSSAHPVQARRTHRFLQAKRECGQLRLYDRAALKDACVQPPTLIALIKEFEGLPDGGGLRRPSANAARTVGGHAALVRWVDHDGAAESVGGTRRPEHLVGAKSRNLVSARARVSVGARSWKVLMLYQKSLYTFEYREQINDPGGGEKFTLPKRNGPVYCRYALRFAAAGCLLSTGRRLCWRNFAGVY